MSDKKVVVPVTFLPGFPDQVIRERLFDERNYRHWEAEARPHSVWPGNVLSIEDFSQWSVGRIYWTNRFGAMYIPRIAQALRDIGYSDSRFVREAEEAGRIADSYRLQLSEAAMVMRIASEEGWLPKKKKD